jgi:hypothetical protein
MSKHFTTMSVFALVLLGTLSALAAEPPAFPLEFAASDLVGIDVSTEQGILEFRTTAAPKIRVETSAPPDSDLCNITAQIVAKRLVIEAKSPKKIFGHSAGCKVGFVLEGPATLPVVGLTGTGNITAQGWQNKLDLLTGTGDITLENVGGELHLKSGSGDIRGNSTAIKASIVSGSGDIQLQGLAGPAEIKTGSGKVTLGWSKIPDKGDVIIKSGSGEVALTLPASARIKTDFSTGSGKVMSEFGNVSESALLISVATGSGDITLKKSTTAN